MPKLTFVQSDGTRMEISAEAGRSVMEAAIANSIPGIVAECGGSMACATCHVFLDDATAELAGPLAADEDDMLDFSAVPRRATSRLSCQVQVADTFKGAVITIPETQV